MLINKPCCDFKMCRNQFGGNCMNEAEYARCSYNRQKEEISVLERHNKDFLACNLLGNCLVYSKNLKDYNDMRIGLKIEAVTAFVEQLKEKAIEYGILNSGGVELHTEQAISITEIDDFFIEWGRRLNGGS